MKENWREFFRKFPDYRNEFISVSVQDDVVVMVVVLCALSNSLMVQACGLLKYEANVSQSEECPG